MSLPGKGLEGHICPPIVTYRWYHLEHHEIGGAKEIIGGHELLKYGE